MITSNPASLRSAANAAARRFRPAGNWRATLFAPRFRRCRIISEVSFDNMHLVVHLNLDERLVRAADIGGAPLDRDTDVHDLSTGNFEGLEECPHRSPGAHDVVDDDYAVAFVHTVEIELAFRVAGGLVDGDFVRQVVYPFSHDRHRD